MFATLRVSLRLAYKQPVGHTKLGLYVKTNIMYHFENQTNYRQGLDEDPICSKKVETH